MHSQKLWTKDFILATLAGLFAAMVFYITLTTLAMYATEYYQANASIAGLVASIFVFGCVLGRIFSGRYIERIGRRKLTLASCALFFLFGFAYLLPVGIGPLLIIRLLHGAIFGMVHNALSTVVLSFIPKSRFGEGIGFFSLNFTIATALGPFIGMFVVEYFSYTLLFAVCVLSAFLCLLLACFLNIEKPVFTDEQIANLKRKFALRDIFEPGALPLSIVVIIMSLCFTGVTTFLGSYTAELQLPYIAPLFFIVYGAFILIFRPLAGRLLDKRGDNIVMLPTIVFFAASLLTLAFANGPFLFMLAAVLMALGYGNILIMGQTIAVKSVDAHRVGTANSTYFVFSDAGMGLGPLILGVFVTWNGFSGMFLVEAGVVTLSILLYYVLHGKHAHEKKPVSVHG
jgi:MFS family permease